MKLSSTIKEAIKNEYANWFNSQYGDKSLEERRRLGAFFTPPEITIRMIENIDSFENKTILDPTCGTGNLLVACIIAGADPQNIYGNEYDAEFTRLCKERLAKYGVPKYHIHQGDALNQECLKLESFKPDFKDIQYERIELW